MITEKQVKNIEKELKIWASEYGNDQISNEEYHRNLLRIGEKAQKMIEELGCRGYTGIKNWGEELECGDLDEYNPVYCEECQKLKERLEAIS